MSHGWSNVVGAIAALVLLLNLAGCAWGQPTPEEVPPVQTPKGEDEVKEIVYAASAKPRQVAPEVPAADLGALVEGNNHFALDLYHALRGPADVERPFANPDANLLYSPYSTSLAQLLIVRREASGCATKSRIRSPAP